jgi:hypothetical protein
MSQVRGDVRSDQSSFHGRLLARDEVWDVCFVDVQRDRQDWLIECVVAGPTVHHVVIRCAAEMGPGETARRTMAALRDWLAAGQQPRRAHIAVPETLAGVC